ncbi:MAG: hypothetical protein S4CHLAM102_02420 [Chlamydiia bacterium]|nr:hypothetical protein [Chlamydiia bacterium]
MRSQLFILICSVANFLGGGYLECAERGKVHCWQEVPDRQQTREVFLASFGACYDSISPEAFGKGSKEELCSWLEEAFDELYLEHSTMANRTWIITKVDGLVAGFLVLDTEKYPEEIYIALLAVDPSHQGKGIASALIRQALASYTDCPRFTVTTRGANTSAIQFYTALGFTQTENMPSGYQPPDYVSFELTTH